MRDRRAQKAGGDGGYARLLAALGAVVSLLEITPMMVPFAAADSSVTFAPTSTSQYTSSLTYKLTEMYVDCYDPAGVCSCSSIGLGDSAITGTIPAELSACADLMDLDLQSNCLTGTLPPELSRMLSLNSLLLSSNRLTGTLPPEFSAFSNLGKLALDDNRLTGSIPAEFGELAPYPLYELCVPFAYHANAPLTTDRLSVLSALGADQVLVRQ